MCHGSPTLDSFQFKTTREAAESNKDSKEPNEAKQESTNDSKDSKECEKKIGEAVLECRLNSSQNQICPANQVWKLHQFWFSMYIYKDRVVSQCSLHLQGSCCFAMFSTFTRFYLGSQVPQGSNSFMDHESHFFMSFILPLPWLIFILFIINLIILRIDFIICRCHHWLMWPTSSALSPPP